MNDSKAGLRGLERVSTPRGFSPELVDEWLHDERPARCLFLEGRISCTLTLSRTRLI